MMLTNKVVCDQIHSIYPDFGQCGENFNVIWDKDNNVWAVDFEYNGNKIRHYLDNEDAAACVNRNQCIGLGIEFGQFR